MKRGRKGKVDLNDQLEIYREFAKDLIDENGKIRPASSDIYQKLSLKLNMTAKAINLVIRKNSNEIFGKSSSSY